MTKKEAIRKHRKMWMKLAISGSPNKPKTENLYDCYLCAYDNQNCDNCLLIWPSIKKHRYNLCPCTRSYFGEWSCKNISLARRKALALKIANLKERK